MIPRRNIIRSIKKAFAQPGYAVSAFYKRLKSFLTYKFYSGYSAYPETISLFLTYRCNLRCKMCGQWGMMGSSHEYSQEELKQHLSLNDIERVLNDVKRFKPNITLFGGEPLLYKDWQEAASMVKGRGMRCNIITNGILLEKAADAIVDAGVDEIIFSLDGPRDIHDEIRGAKGTYDKAWAGFKRISELKTKKGLKKPIVNISTAIFETNYERLDEVVQSAEEMGASSITFHHLIFIGKETYARHDKIFQNRFSCSSPDWAGFIRDGLPKIEPEKLIEILNKVKYMKIIPPPPPLVKGGSPSSPLWKRGVRGDFRSKTNIDISVYPNLTDDEIKKYYTTFDFLPDTYKKRCMSPWMVAYIFPDGSVRPCQSLNFPIGNIKDASFTEIWNDKEALKFRSVLKKERYFPVCSKCTEFYRF